MCPAGPVSWRSLLLPSSPPAQTSLLPPPSLSLGPLVKNLTQFDFHHDFHLPDDQFASLKLHKLRQVAVETGVEHLTSPSFNTRGSVRRRESCHGARNPVMPLPLMPAATDSPTEPKPTSAQSADLQDMLMDHKLIGTWTSQSLPEELRRENPERRANAKSAESLPSAQQCAGVDACEDTRPVILNPYSQSGFLTDSTHRSDRPFTPQPCIDSADRPTGKEGDVISQTDDTEVKAISSEEQTHSPGVVSSLTLGSTTHQKEDDAVSSPLPFDCPRQRSPEEPSSSCTAAHECSDTEGPGVSPVRRLNVKSAAEKSYESSESAGTPERSSKKQDECSPRHSVRCQLLLSPPLTSAPFLNPHLRSSLPPSSPALPSLGVTPQPVPAASPLSPSPSAPVLMLPPPHSPSTQALSPPALSPCPSLTPTSLTGQIQAPREPPQRVEPAASPTVCRIHVQGSGGQVAPEAVDGHMMRRTLKVTFYSVSSEYHLKSSSAVGMCVVCVQSPAGGCLVDACCLPGSSGGLCVAAAGKWAVCLWSQAAASDWSLSHTWSFTEVSVWACVCVHK